MPKLLFGVSPTSNVIRVKLMDSTSTTGGGLTGLTSSSSGLKVAVIGISASSPTTYTAAGSTIDTIATLGTWAAPTTNHCRFKEIDATNMPGVYELQFSDTVFSSYASVIISISGATNLAQFDTEIQCQNTPANVININGTAQTARDIGASVLLSPGTGTGQISLASGAVTVGTNSDKTGYALTSGEESSIATAVWAATTRTLSAFSFTVAANLTQILGTALTETAGYLAAGFNKFFNIASPSLTVAGINQTGDSYAIVNNGTYGNSALNTAIGTRLATSGYTAPDNANIGNIYNVVKSGGTGDNAAIKAKTDQLTFTVANKVDASATLLGTADANIVSIDGALTNGHNATLNLKQLSVVNNDGTAVVFTSIGSDGDGLQIRGNGIGNGASICSGSGATGDGMVISALSTGGSGVYCRGSGAHAGLTLVPGAHGNGLEAVGGSIEGSAIKAFATSGDAVQFVSACSGGNGLYVYGYKGVGISAGGDIGIKALGSVKGIWALGLSYGIQSIEIQAIQAKTDQLTFTVENKVDATATVSGTADVNVVNWKGSTAPAMTGDAFARLGAPANASIASDIAVVNAKTTNLPASPAAVGSAMTLASGAIITATFATDAISAAAVSAAAVTKIQAGLSSSTDITGINNKLDAIYTAEGEISNQVSVVGADVQDVVAVLPDGGAKISKFALTDTIDGVEVGSIFELSACMVDGRFKKDYPAMGDVTFFKRDNVTVLMSVHVTETERTRY